SLEQVLNTWLADQKPANEDLRSVAGEAMRGFELWVADIAAGTDSAWQAGMFRGPADIFRTEHRRVPFVLAEIAAPAEEVSETVPAEAHSDEEVQLQPAAVELPAEFDFDLSPVVSAADVPSAGVDDALEIDGIELPEFQAVADTVPAELAISDELPLPAASDAGLEISFSEGDDLIFDLGDFGTAAAPETAAAADDQPPTETAELSAEEPLESLQPLESVDPKEPMASVESLEAP